MSGTLRCELFDHKRVLVGKGLGYVVRCNRWGCDADSGWMFHRPLKGEFREMDLT